jgi:sugar phosphate isomerase/epimerase/N-acetylglucosamine kinase-like BadF-type ATPase
MLWAVDAGSGTTTLLLPGGTRAYGSTDPASVGTRTATRTLRALFADVAAALDGEPGAGWIATAAGFTDPGDEPERLRDLARDAGVRGRVVVSNDALPWLVAPPLCGRGVVVVCGTGSRFVAGDGRGGLYQVGGYGYLGSDEGSAFDLGLAGLRAAVRADDDRGPATTIGARLSVTFGRTPAELAHALAAEAFPKASVAALAPAVCDAWLDADEPASALVSAAIGELVLGVCAVRDRARLSGEWSVAAGGSMLRGCPPMMAELERRLRAEACATSVVAVTEPAETVRAALEVCVLDATRARPAPVFEVERPKPAPPLPPVDTDHPVPVGLCLEAWGGSYLPAAIEHAALVGADVVDLPTDSPLGLVDLARWARDGQHRAELRAALGGVIVACVSNSRDGQLLLGPHGPHTDPVRAGTPREKRDHALRYATDTVRLAADLGAPHARLMFGVPDLARWLPWRHSTVSWADNIAAWCEEARPVLSLAAEHGVTILIEPHPKQVAYDRASARRLLDAAARTEPRAAVKLCVDPANLAAIGHDPVDAVRGWGTELGAAHAKDLQRWTEAAEPRGAGWSRFGPGPPVRFRTLGAGDLPWHSIVAALLDEGFAGALYVESQDALLPKEQSVSRSVAFLRDLLPQSDPAERTW